MSFSVSRSSRRLFALVAVPLLAIACKEKANAPSTAAAGPSAVAKSAPESFRVVFETSKGNFTVDVKRTLAPKGSDRFHELVESGYFTDLRFFRVVPGFIVQWGMHADPATNKTWSNSTITDDPVAASNKRGTIVFATAGPNTRSNQFFINLGDNAMLDAQGFSPFGEVVEGMAVVDSLYGGYGDVMDQGMISEHGNRYLMQAFPKLDYIKSAKIVR